MQAIIQMMKKLLLFLLFFFLISCNKEIYHVKQDKIIVPDNVFDLVEDMKIGWNLGNSLDACKKELGFTYDTEGIWRNPLTTKEMIDYVKEIGFRSIRIPVTYYNHIDENGIIDSKWLDRVEELVNWALDADLYTIINIHHDTGMNPSLNWIYADSDKYIENRDKYINLWKQIAKRFKDYDLRLIFQGSGEWMNEERNWNRSDSMDDFKIVHELNQDFIDTIRESGGNNSNRYLMISAFSASAEEDIVRAMFHKTFNDNRLILSVHSYASDIEEIKKGYQVLKEISKDYNIPIVVDEFGPKIYYLKSKKLKIIEEFLNKDIVCMFWDDGYEYKLFDREELKVVDIDIINRIMEIIYKD